MWGKNLSADFVYSAYSLLIFFGCVPGCGRWCKKLFVSPIGTIPEQKIVAMMTVEMVSPDGIRDDKGVPNRDKQKKGLSKRA